MLKKMQCFHCGGTVALDRMSCEACGRDMLPQDIVSSDGVMRRAANARPFLDNVSDAVAAFRGSSARNPLPDEGSEARVRRDLDLAAWRASAQVATPTPMAPEEAARLNALNDRMQRDRWRVVLIPPIFVLLYIAAWLIRR